MAACRVLYQLVATKKSELLSFVFLWMKSQKVRKLTFTDTYLSG